MNAHSYHPVKLRRLSIQMSQVDLAESSGVDRVTISNMETGLSYGYKNATIERLASVFRISPEYLRMEIYQFLANVERRKLFSGGRKK